MKPQGYPDVHEYGKLGSEFMRPVVDDMARADPAKPPIIDRVVACFADIQKGPSVRKLRTRVLGGEREHPYLPPSNYGVVSPDSGHFNASLRGAGSLVLDYRGSQSESKEGISSWDGIRKGVHTREPGTIQE
jgi:hypothetical protein